METLLPQMLQKITRQALIGIPVLAAISYFFAGWPFSFNIVLGGGISLFSFRTVAWAVRKFIGMQMAQPVIMGISILKIMLIFVFLVLLAYFGFIRPVPLLVGFVAVMAIIIREGFITSRKAGT
ncbi:MAG TPA: ATP synthase subunit I [Dissulfurispiraceae bacterium]|nr:ATP synthase subunit I [Dissulfurispiraceae bacterium]